MVIQKIVRQKTAISFRLLLGLRKSIIAFFFRIMSKVKLIKETHSITCNGLP